MPVPAGISLPMMTFSLSPTRPSLLPSIAASVSTRVVSWNDAADSHDSVASDAFVIPISSGRPSAGLLALRDQPLVARPRTGGRRPSRPGQERRVTGFGHADPAQHLADDHLDVLVVDRHALLPVHLLHLVAEVLLGLADALDLEDLLRVERCLLVTDETLAGHDLLAVLDREVRAPRDGCSSSVPSSATIVMIRSPFSFSPRRTTPGRLGEERRALRRAGLEQLDDTREAVGDVLTRDTTGVERTHRQLRARLTDRLRGDDADRLAEVDELAGGEHRAVAAAADPGAVPALLASSLVRLGHGSATTRT